MFFSFAADIMATVTKSGAYASLKTTLSEGVTITSRPASRSCFNTINDFTICLLKIKENHLSTNHKKEIINYING